MIAKTPGLDALVERVRNANASRRPLCLRGGGTKDFYGETPAGELLDTRVLDGPCEHEPTELVVTAPAGMSVVALEAQLAGHGSASPSSRRISRPDRQSAATPCSFAVATSRPAHSRRSRRRCAPFTSG